MNTDKTLIERYAQIKKELPCMHTSVFLNPSPAQSKNQAQEGYVAALERLNAFIKNGHSAKSLPFSYQSVHEC